MTFWKRPRPAEFAEILAGLEREHARDEDFGPDAETGPIAPETASPSRLGLRQVLAAFSWPQLGGVRKPQASRAYEEPDTEPTDRDPSAEESGADVRPVPPRARPARTEDDLIAEELGLKTDLGKPELEQIRRDFAKKNHPDLCAPSQRMRAARRMSIANSLIDARLKKWRPPPRG